MKPLKLMALSLASMAVLSACQSTSIKQVKTGQPEYYGTQDQFAKESVYFLMTDRFVDGDKSNNHLEQGGEHHTFNREMFNPAGEQNANVGYLGGDFKGIVDNIDYLTDMGFSALWITPLLITLIYLLMVGSL
ncbi:alpha-amylase family glycosyl hydrolase [Paraglaciecola aquimarina]|uniref:Alpha-amylase family glycosyl hydrolase n=1 Tax=Paraglaciecola aquimarina TaxID=1235557 RepID=A0ABU3T173_9ALTE|nr:alpha-amylase family glycosyl hydrolase [Paraglaciecola aquimarina]MDU0355958.1 alpha-amylase family glycosyl hydrolase [Paraglaciecola aquimarina]